MLLYEDCWCWGLEGWRRKEIFELEEKKRGGRMRRRRRRRMREEEKRLCLELHLVEGEWRSRGVSPFHSSSVKFVNGINWD